MASVDAGSSSVRATSDEVYDHICGACSTDGVDEEAKHYCKDCRRKICDTRKDYHRKLAVTKNHTIVSVNKSLVTDSGHQGVALLCCCNKNQQVAFYRETHHDVICSPCKSFQYHECNTNSIKHKSSGYKASTFQALLSGTKSLKDKYEHLLKEAGGIDSELKKLKDACKKEIRTFRNDIGRFLDSLEKNMIAELDQWELEESNNFKQNISTLAAALDLLKVDIKLLDDAKRDGDKRDYVYSRCAGVEDHPGI